MIRMLSQQRSIYSIRTPNQHNIQSQEWVLVRILYPLGQTNWLMDIFFYFRKGKGSLGSLLAFFDTFSKIISDPKVPPLLFEVFWFGKKRFMCLRSDPYPYEHFTLFSFKRGFNLLCSRLVVNDCFRNHRAKAPEEAMQAVRCFLSFEGII